MIYGKTASLSESTFASDIERRDGKIDDSPPGRQNSSIGCCVDEDRTILPSEHWQRKRMERTAVNTRFRYCTR